MKNQSLDIILEDACRRLQNIGDSSNNLRPTGTLNPLSYDFYGDCIKYSSIIDDAKELLNVRSSIYSMIINFSICLDSDNPNNIISHGISVPFWHARILGLQSYMATTWALYDNISKVAGELICTDSFSKNLSKPIKLPEHFLGTKNEKADNSAKNEKANVVGGRMHLHLKKSYGWPIGFSYAIRNWSLHDGDSKDGINLFSSRDIKQDPFRISDKAWKDLEKRCEEKYGLDKSYTRRRKEEWPWKRENIMELLTELHYEVDEAIGILISWAVESIEIQAKQFLIRDTP